MAATSLVRDHGVGVVYTVGADRRNKRYKDAREAIIYTREHAPAVEILLDCNLYSGKVRMSGGAPNGGLSEEWIRFQRALDLPYALTDSGYIAAGQTAHLTTTLQAGEQLGSKVLTALPMATRWLTHDADVLCEQVARVGTPVALMLEDKKDPFDRKNAAAGLVDLLATGVPVSLLRADTSALGAIAHGAAVGAIGATSSLRHFYPVPKDDDDHPDPTKDYLSFVIPDLLGYFSNQRFLNAYDIDRTNPIWYCPCGYCNGTALTWINAIGPLDIPQPVAKQLGLKFLAEHEDKLPPIKEKKRRPHDPRGDAAFQHSVAAIAAFGDELAAVAAARDCSLASAWSLMCERAQTNHFNVKTAHDKGWDPRAAYRRWRDLAAVPAEPLLPPANWPEHEQKGSPPSI